MAHAWEAHRRRRDSDETWPRGGRRLTSKRSGEFRRGCSSRPSGRGADVGWTRASDTSAAARSVSAELGVRGSPRRDDGDTRIGAATARKCVSDLSWRDERLTLVESQSLLGPAAPEALAPPGRSAARRGRSDLRSAPRAGLASASATPRSPGSAVAARALLTKGLVGSALAGARCLWRLNARPGRTPLRPP